MTTTLFDQVETRRLPLADICRDQDLQPREMLVETTIEEYATALAEGATLPPVIIYHDGTSYWLADGSHRCAAADRLQRSTIDAEVRPGTRRDALLHAISANAEHGLRRSDGDKHRAVELALRDPELARLSDRELAGMCKVSPPLVAKVRRALSANGLQIDGETRLVRRGDQVYEQLVSSEARAEAAQARQDDITAQRKTIAAAVLTALGRGEPLTFRGLETAVSGEVGYAVNPGIFSGVLSQLVGDGDVRNVKGARYALAAEADPAPAGERLLNVLAPDDPAPEPWPPQPTVEEWDAANGYTATSRPWNLQKEPPAESDPDEREEVPEGSAEWLAGMAEDDARRAQTEAEAEAAPDDELAGDCTDDDPPAEDVDDSEDWESTLPPTQTALDAERLLKLLPETESVALTRLRERSELPADRVWRAVNLLEADGKIARTRDPKVGVLLTRVAPPDPLADIPADQRITVLRWLHDLRANTEPLLLAAWDGGDYAVRDGDAPGKLASASGWIIPAEKWSSGSKWCTGYVLTGSGRAIYELLLAAHPGETPDTLPSAVARLLDLIRDYVVRLHDLSGDATRTLRGAPHLAGLLPDAPAAELCRAALRAQRQLDWTREALTALVFALQPDAEQTRETMLRLDRH